MSTVVIGLSDKTNAEVIAFAKNVHLKLTGNANVPTPNPALPALQTLITDAETANDAYIAEKDTLRIKMQERDAAMAALMDGLRTEAATVEVATEGDAEKINTTGYRARTGAPPIGIPGTVQNLRVQAAEESGMLAARWEPVYGVDTYELESGTDPNLPTTWTPKGTVKKTSAMVNSFTSGARIWLRVRAIGTAGAGAWSDPAAKIVP